MRICLKTHHRFKIQAGGPEFRRQILCQQQRKRLIPRGIEYRFAIGQRPVYRDRGDHTNNPYMFPSPVTGGMYYPDSINRLHENILKGAGLKHIRLHDMRHTAASLMLQNGVDIKTVSEMLGHFDAGFTLRTYTHTTSRQQAEAADMMGSLMAQSL